MSRIYIKDGPHAGKSYNYSAPVPNVVVLAIRVGPMGLNYHDYVRLTAGVDHFTHSPECACNTKEPGNED